MTVQEYAGPFSFITAFSLNTLRDFGVPFGESFYGPFSLEIVEAGMGLALGPVKARTGLFRQYDVVSSPYSLFISGLGLEAPILELAYQGPLFSFTDRWIGLTHNSALGWPERGAVHKNYGLTLGALRLGFQDIVVFSDAYTALSGRYFDVGHFITPIPSSFIQAIATTPGRPWTEAVNDNSIMGFFCDYSADSWYSYGQVLVDDFYMNWLFDPSAPANPIKMAWSFGGHWESPLGTFGFYHAGATAYTFESFGSSGYNPMYGYSYFPADFFVSGSLTLPIEIEDNMVGYQHGENNLALMATWAKTIAGFSLDSSLEFTLSGTKSAGNPWHEHVYWPEGGEGTKLLDDPVLEKQLVLKGRATYPWRDFAFSLDFALGGVWNRLALTAVDSVDPANQGPLFTPSAEHAFIGRLGLSAGWKRSF